MTLRARSRLTAVVAFTCTAALALSSCGMGGTTSPGGNTGAAASQPPDTLTVLVENGGLQELTPVADAFTKETGSKVNLVELPYDGLFNRLSSELSSGAVSFDVAAVDAVWLSAVADGMVGLDDMFTDDVKKDLFDSLVSEAQYGGKFVGMPVWTNSEILFYRTDLFEDATQKANFKKKYGYDLVPPTTWQQFQDTAEFFTQDTNGDGKTDLYGTDVIGAMETEWLATVSQAGSGGMVLDKDNKVIIDNDQHLKALTFYSDLATKSKVAPSGVAQTDWAAAQNLFYQGKTAMMRFWAHAYRQTPADSVVSGKVGAAPMIAGPGGIAGVPGAWYLSVPTATKKTELAKKFVQYAYDHNDLGIETDLGLAARISAYQKFEDKEGYEHLKPLITTLESPNTVPRPANPKWQEIVDTVLIPMIQKSVEPGADYQALLAKAKTDIEAIVG